MTGVLTYALPINPEPWVVGNAYVGRGGGKAFARIAPDKTLKLYQEAIREALESLGVEKVPGMYELDFFFFRQNAQYKDSAGRTRTRNTPDTTNLQKATEDAIQGVLIENDRDVLRVQSYRMAAGPDVDPMVVIRLAHGLPLAPLVDANLRHSMNEAIESLKRRAEKNVKKAAEANVWTP